MRRILAHPDPLTTRIGERPMSIQQSDRAHQIDLFDGVTPTQTPAWRDLPEQTRDTLTA